MGVLYNKTFDKIHARDRNIFAPAFKEEVALPAATIFTLECASIIRRNHLLFNDLVNRNEVDKFSLKVQKTKKLKYIHNCYVVKFFLVNVQNTFSDNLYLVFFMSCSFCLGGIYHDVGTSR